jgi:putative addiction module killer protein
MRRASKGDGPICGRASFEARLRRAPQDDGARFSGRNYPGELRVDYGSGYRVYFVKRGTAFIILLRGGDKSSQKRDIRKAIEMAKEV